MCIFTKKSVDRYIFTDVTETHDESITMLEKLAGNNIYTDTEYLDNTNLEAIREIFKREKVQDIINYAIWIYVDGADYPKKYALVEKLNVTASENLAKAMNEVDGWLVHISTDYVFGKEPYNTPCNVCQKGTSSLLFSFYMIDVKSLIYYNDIK